MQSLPFLLLRVTEILRENIWGQIVIYLRGAVPKFSDFFGREISILLRDMPLHCFISVFIPSWQAKFQVSRLKG